MSNVDFHVHTTLSDGMFSAENVVEEAKRCRIKVLAITDHNCTQDLTKLRLDHRDIALVQGSEISCIYTDPAHIQHEIHVVALGFDPNHPKIQEIFNKNHPDRRPYLEKIFKRLEDCGIYIGTYDDLEREYPKSRHVGRIHIANKMRKTRICSYG